MTSNFFSPIKYLDQYLDLPRLRNSMPNFQNCALLCALRK
jgi:hypothetical protein